MAPIHSGPSGLSNTHNRNNAYHILGGTSMFSQAGKS